MLWSDERYVRVYTRDTAEWLALGWEAQSLLVALFRKADRAGIITLGKTGLRGIAGLTGFPIDVVERAIPLLAADGCVTETTTGIIIPNFMDAQETPQSDQARKRAQRERARGKAMADVTKRDEQSQNVTESHATSRDVTASHTESHGVTPCCADPCCAMLDQRSVGIAASDPDGSGVCVGDLSESPDGQRVGEPQPAVLGQEGPAMAPTTPSTTGDTAPIQNGPAKGIPVTLSSTTAEARTGSLFGETIPANEAAPDPADAVFDEWLVGWHEHVGAGREPTLPTDDKRRKNIARLMSKKGGNYTLDNLKSAVRGIWLQEPSFIRRNGKIRASTVSMDLIRDASHVEKFMGLDVNTDCEEEVSRSPFDPPPLRSGAIYSPPLPQAPPEPRKPYAVTGTIYEMAERLKAGASK
jgi:hypothetical protein